MLDVLNVFAGFDEREEVGFHTFVSSAVHQCTMPLSIMPVGAKLFPGFASPARGDESNDFTRVRFLIPYILGYRGWALFCDGSDMVLRGDLAELWAMRDHYMAVQVVKHEYKTQHPRKYVGTQMEADNRDYRRKNWSSVMLINCGHYAWRNLTPAVVERMTGEDLHQFEFIDDDRIGELPVEWNWLADEYDRNSTAKLLHWTAGTPAFPAYTDAPMANEWARAALKIQHKTL
jgi:lipopolysaccharide biosynthesis glycosyltransferase